MGGGKMQRTTPRAHAPVAGGRVVLLDVRKRDLHQAVLHYYPPRQTATTAAPVTATTTARRPTTKPPRRVALLIELSTATDGDAVIVGAGDAVGIGVFGASSVQLSVMATACE